MKKLIVYSVVATLSLQNLAFASNRLDEVVHENSASVRLQLNTLKRELRNLDQELEKYESNVHDLSYNKTADTVALAGAAITLFGSAVILARAPKIKSELERLNKSSRFYVEPGKDLAKGLQNIGSLDVVKSIAGLLTAVATMANLPLNDDLRNNNLNQLLSEIKKSLQTLSFMSENSQDNQAEILIGQIEKFEGTLGSKELNVDFRKQISLAVLQAVFNFTQLELFFNYTHNHRTNISLVPTALGMVFSTLYITLNYGDQSEVKTEKRRQELLLAIGKVRESIRASL